MTNEIVHLLFCYRSNIFLTSFGGNSRRKLSKALTFSGDLLSLYCLAQYAP